jgi:hypothetical protein
MPSAVSAAVVPPVPSDRDRDDAPSPPRRPSSTAAVAPPSPHALLLQSRSFTLAAQDRAASIITLLLRRSKRPAPSAAALVTTPLVPPPSTVVGPLAAAAARAWTSLGIVDDGGAAPIAATTLEGALAAASHHVWGVHLRPMQLRALLFLFGNDNFERKMLLVARTGGGKSHVIRMTGTMFRGIHLIIHPLLVLTADQITKFTCASTRHGSVMAHNCDEQASSSRAHRDRLMQHLLDVGPDTSRTVYLFASPHFLATRAAFLNAIILCSRRGTLRSVTIDEAHLLARQGASFRPEVRMLRESFFLPVWGNTIPEKRPLLVCTTATSSHSDKLRLEHITCTEFRVNHCCWFPAAHFQQRSIEMRLVVGNDYTRSTTLVVNHLADTDSSCFFFVNTKSRVDDIVKAIETKIDSHSTVTADVLHITGGMKKPAKYANIGIFTGKIVLDGVDARVMVATSAGDLGVDHPNAQLIINCEWPEDCSTAVQRRGRASRAGEKALFVIVAGIGSYLGLLRRFFIDNSCSAPSDAGAPLAGYNNSEVASPVRQGNAAQTLSTIKTKHALSKAKSLALGKELHADFRSMLSCFCLNLGCQHSRLEAFCATGVLRPHVGDNGCVTACPVCACTFHDTFFPVSKPGVTQFLQSERGLHENATTNGLLALVWKNKHWTHQIFRKKMYQVKRTNIEAFFLQLIAADFMRADVDRDKKSLCWSICREKGSQEYLPFRYLNDENWNGIALL